MKKHISQNEELPENINHQVHEMIHQLYQTTRVLTKSINRSLYSTNIYGSEWTIIRTIKLNGTMTQTALSSYLNIEPAAISKTLRQLSSKDLIHRKPGEDRREKYIYLSPTAEENYAEWDNLIGQNCYKIKNAISHEEKEQLLSILAKIQTALEDND